MRFSVAPSAPSPAATVAAAAAAVAAAVLFALFVRRGGAAPRPGGRLRVGFAHPDLGIGGAERLVVDAAVALQQRGHDVTLHTAHHDPSHCFEETRGLLRVVVHGDWLPRRLLGRFWALCAYIRMLYVAACMATESYRHPYDVIIVDQVSFCMPVLRLCRVHGIIFYCHYPDYLLTQRQGLLKRLYRAPLDWAEEMTTGMADVVLVNSRFTATVFARAFPRLARRGLVPDVLYPALNLADQDRLLAEAEQRGAPEFVAPGEQLLLSLNRFERKKNVGLAVRAVAALPAEQRSRVRLVLAGGYDPRLPENVEHAEELQQLAAELGLAAQVTQRRSISALEKAQLLRRAAAMLYTPDGEHLGIVPLEAMYARLPVVAVNSGGPLETVADGETGFHRPQDPVAWAECLRDLLGDAALRERLGAAGRRRVEGRFSLGAFGSELDSLCRRLLA